MEHLTQPQTISKQNMNNFYCFDNFHKCFSNVSDHKKYIGIFLQNVPNDLEILRTAYNQKDYHTFKETSHKIKGNVAYMGIKNLTELFTSAEYGNLDKLGEAEFKRIFENIEKTCLSAIDELQEVKRVL